MPSFACWRIIPSLREGCVNRPRCLENAASIGKLLFGSPDEWDPAFISVADRSDAKSEFVSYLDHFSLRNDVAIDFQ